jgi:hypothetical protein
MKTLLLFAAITLAAAASLFASDEHVQTIRGTVTEAVTGYPIPGAYVVVKGSEPAIGTSTDVNGKFVIKNVPIGRQTLEITFIGYEPKIISNLMLVSGKETIADAALEESVTAVGEVTVKATVRKSEAINEMAMVSARTFSVEETERFAGSLGDPARMVANYAGVMTQNDSRNDIIIRGNSPTGVLWRLEGIEIPNPNHFGALGTTGGPVSMVNNNLLTNSDFLTGAFPAEFGNATAGAFDLNLRSGNHGRTEFTGQIGFNGFEAGVEGPAFTLGNGQKATYLASYRYSTLDLMHRLGFGTGTGTAIPQYQDFTFLTDIPTAKAGRIKLFGLWGRSFISMGRDVADTTETQYNARGTATDFGADIGVAGASHTWFFNENTRLRSTLSWQFSGSNVVLDSVSNEQFIPFVRNNNHETRLSFSTQLRRKFSARDNLSAGFTADLLGVIYTDSIMDRDLNRFITRTDIDGNLSMYRGYLQWQHNFGSRLTSYTGVHIQYFGLNGEVSGEPRLALRYKLSGASTINVGAGLHSQIQSREVYFYQDYNELTGSYIRTNEELKFTKSGHLVAGYQYQPLPLFRIKAETYYQHLYNVPVKESFPEFSLINTGEFFAIPITDSLVNEGRGRNYGVELTIEKFLDKGWYMLFTASLFDSKYTGHDGIWRNTAFNGNYVMNLLGGYEIKVGRNSIVTADIKGVWAGGKRYIPIDVAESAATKSEVRDWSRAYENRYNDYFRTDLRIGFKMNSRRFSQEWGIDLQNITGYRSIFIEGYDPRKDEVYTVYQQGFMPMFLYRIQF